MSWPWGMKGVRGSVCGRERCKCQIGFFEAINERAFFPSTLCFYLRLFHLPPLVPAVMKPTSDDHFGKFVSRSYQLSVSVMYGPGIPSLLYTLCFLGSTAGSPVLVPWGNQEGPKSLQMTASDQPPHPTPGIGYLPIIQRLIWLLHGSPSWHLSPLPYSLMNIPYEKAMHTINEQIYNDDFLILHIGLFVPWRLITPKGHNGTLNTSKIQTLHCG